MRSLDSETARDLARPFGLNYPEFPDSCRRIEFVFSVNVYQMLIYGFDGNLIQLREQPLGEPDGLAVDAHLDVEGAVLIDQELPFGRNRELVICHSPIP